jgi:hypothetical protein
MDVSFDEDLRDARRAHRVRNRRATRTVATNDDVNATLLRGHPAGAPPVVRGPLAVGGPALEGAFHVLYRPEAAALIVVGPVDPDQVVGWARESFGKWRGVGPGPSPLTPSLVSVDPPGPASRTILLYPVEDRSTTKVTVECLLTPGSTASARAVLGALAEQELWRRLREAQGLTYAPGTEVWDVGYGTATLSAKASVAPGSATRALEEMLKMFADIAAGNIDADALGRARNAAARQRAFQLSTVSGLNDALARLWEAGRPFSEIDAPMEAGPSFSPVAGLLARCIGHEVATVIGGSADAESASTRWPEARTVRR